MGGWTGGQRVTPAHGRGAIELKAATHYIVPMCYAHGSMELKALITLHVLLCPVLHTASQRNCHVISHCRDLTRIL